MLRGQVLNPALETRLPIRLSPRILIHTCQQVIERTTPSASDLSCFPRAVRGPQALRAGQCTGSGRGFIVGAARIQA